MTEETLFALALEKAAGPERQAFLDAACGGDAILRERVERLLASDKRASGILDHGPDTVTCTSQPPPSLEADVPFAGRFKLRQKLGEGGMGEVWVADQTEPLQRRVALKVVRPGLDSARMLARFDQERQALALMDHPNIARVLDAGVTDGRPYFVMDLIKGVPITQYCDAAKLSPRERLELFVPVCHAVQHAHQKGIIHRDLKPSNILIGLYDGKPVPKVIDFGVAKATGPQLTEQSIYTEVGSLIGTLEYMSPEQAELNNLDVDTRSDIYSLGVVLYELLAGSVPFSRRELQAAAFVDMLRMIKEVEPPKPSTRLSGSGTLPSVAAMRQTEPKKLLALLRGELDWIVMKCLEKDRGRRYETANGFAMDLQSYLADEPVQACSPSAVYRLRKFVRRNRAVVSAASVVLLTLVGGIVGTTHGLVRAEQRAEGERLARKEAQEREAETSAVLDFVQNRVLAANRPAGLQGGLGPDVTVRQAIESALPFVATSFRDQPLIEARLRMTLGLSYCFLGEAKAMAEQYQAARAIYTRHLGPEHPDTLCSGTGVAAAHSILGRLAEARELFDEVLALQKVNPGPDHSDTLWTMHFMALNYARLGRTGDAVRLNEETLSRRKSRLGADHHDTLWSMSNLADCHGHLGEHREALRLNEAVLALRKEKLGPDHPDSINSLNQLGVNLHDLGRHAEALKVREETLPLMQRKFGPDHPDTLWLADVLAESYDATGRRAAARKLRLETVELAKARLSRDHGDAPWLLNTLARCYAGLGEHEEALKTRREILAAARTRHGPDHPETLFAMQEVAVSLVALRRDEEALKLLQETLAGRRDKLGSEHRDTLWTVTEVAARMVTLGRGAEAVPLIDECVRRVEGKLVHAGVPPFEPRLIELRLRHFEKNKDAAGCRASAEMWERLNRTDADSLYNAACFRAVTAAALRGAEGTAAEVDRSIAWLEKAVAAGFTRHEHLKRDRDLNALRGRAEFKKLLAALEAK